jgi:hypothetical protein
MSAVAVERTHAFVCWFRDLHRWSVGSIIKTDWYWPVEMVRPLSLALTRKSVDVDRQALTVDGIRLVTLHFDGEMELRSDSAVESFKGRLFHADPGDVIYSKIDVRNGAIGIVQVEFGRVCVSSEFPVYAVDPEVADAGYVKLLFRTAAFRRKINSMISGASGRKRVQPSDLESVEVPLPPLPVQRKVVAVWEAARVQTDKTRDALVRVVDTLDTELRASARMEALKRSCLVADWSDLNALDIKSARASLFRLDNPSFKPLGEYVEEATKLVKPWEEPDRDWPVYGVNNKEGVVFSHFQKGKDFNAPYKRIQKDWFFHNPTRSSVGSLGVVPEVPPDAITSPEYQVWRITKGLSIGYVATLIATPLFIELIQVHRVGAVKQRLYVENLLQISIPQVPDAMQQRVALDRERALQAIADAKTRAEAAKVEVEAMILGTMPVPN